MTSGRSAHDDAELPDDAVPRTADVVVIGSGLVGACCAYESSMAGLSVVVIDRGHLAAGTTASGEGNILVSDKVPGAELELAHVSRRRWVELAGELDADIEFVGKGGVIVARDGEQATGLAALAARQREAGIDAIEVTADDLAELEPHLAPELPGGVHYPQDCQVQPVLASAALLRRARDRGARVLARTTVIGIDQDAGGRVRAVVTDRGTITTPWVVNAAGPWSADTSALVDIDLPMRPRRGHVLVTEPLGPRIHHKVYDAAYVGTLTADPGGAQVSSVVEATRAGTILIGSSREFVGWNRQVDGALVRRIAARAVELFPSLAGVQLMRAYVGFRPWLPDHLPAIGEEPSAPGFVQATGHEGAGIGLAPGTGMLIRAVVTGAEPPMDANAFRPDRPALVRPADLAPAAPDAAGGGDRSEHPTPGRGRANHG